MIEIGQDGIEPELVAGAVGPEDPEGNTWAVDCMQENLAIYEARSF